MLFEYRYALSLLKQLHENQTAPKINHNDKTKSDDKISI